MDRKGTWIIAGAILLGMVLVAATQVVNAPRDTPAPAAATQPADPPRYQVVKVTDSEFIIMDVITGDLYSAKLKDLKPYDARPGVGIRRQSAV
jgi:hypothetical protein